MSKSGAPTVDPEKQKGPKNGYSRLADPQVFVPVTFQNDSPSIRGRARTWGDLLGKDEMDRVAASAVASPAGTARDDLYINDIGLRRGFASEFLANLEARRAGEWRVFY